MIKFNYLAVEKGDTLIVDVSVLDLPYYSNLYISEILVDNQDSYIDGGPSSKAVKIFSTEEDLKDVRVEIKDTHEVFPRELDEETGSLKPGWLCIHKDLLFVYVKVKGTPRADAPCIFDSRYTLKITLNTCGIYNHAMQVIRETVNDCDIPRNFIDEYLRFKALQLSVETEHYREAIEYYNRFFKKNLKPFNINKCGCNG